MFEKYPFLKANLHCDDFILVVFQTVFPGEFTAEKPTVDLFKVNFIFCLYYFLLKELLFIEFLAVGCGKK